MVDSYFSRKQDTYDEHPDLLNWIESDPSNPLNQISSLVASGPRVLDVGCGAGLLGRLVKRKNPTVKLRGVEPSIGTDQSGISVYEKFHQGYLADALDHDWVSQNEWFVFADVIEHITYPDNLLRSLIERAPRDAQYVFSVPNVAYYQNRLNLMSGDWNYSRSGILESTHVRFFTIESFLQLLAYVGLSPSAILVLNRLFPPGESPLLLTYSEVLSICVMGNKNFPFCYQFVIQASLQEQTDYTLTSIGEAGKSTLFWSRIREKLTWGCL